MSCLALATWIARASASTTAPRRAAAARLWTSIWNTPTALLPPAASLHPPSFRRFRCGPLWGAADDTEKSGRLYADRGDVRLRRQHGHPRTRDSGDVQELRLVRRDPERDRAQSRGAPSHGRDRQRRAAERQRS